MTIEALIDSVIDASAINGKDLVYCLGPFARRVSFSAQQYRALNLVYALRRRNKFEAGNRVAVVGAGVAGLTAAAGLIGYGCEVDVFEAATETVVRQRHTDHRFVHPTVNQWPAASLSLTTELPFLEWAAGRCSDVTKSLADQFELLRGSNRLFLKHRVIEITDMAAGAVRLRVKPRLEANFGYKLVIIAIGFGEERVAVGFERCDYWRPDGLENIRSSGEIEDFLVSGCGDGGLIDALRVVHCHFDKGQLAFDTAMSLSGTPLASDIRTGEERARSANDPSGLAKVYGDASQLLQSDSAYADLNARLTKSLGGGGLVYLLDKTLAEPFSLNAAPVHKLLIAHARDHGNVTFRNSEAALEGDCVKFAGISIPAPPKSKVIIRHGPQVDFGRLLSADEVAVLRRKQESFSDLHAEKLWEEPYPVPAGLPKRDLGDPGFISSRVPLATRAVRSILEDADILPLAGRLRAIYGGAIPKGAPTSLFGIPVDNEVRKAVRGIGG